MERQLSREEAEKSCVAMAESLREGSLAQVQSLKRMFYDTIPDGQDLDFIWTLTGDALGHIVTLLTDQIRDIERAGYLPRKA